MYSQNRKHVPGKNFLYKLHFYESNITHACHVTQGGTTLKTHQNVIKYTRQEKLLNLSENTATVFYR